MTALFFGIVFSIAVVLGVIGIALHIIAKAIENLR